MNHSIGEWVSSGLQSFQPSREIGLRAFRHLSEKTKRDLFSSTEHAKQNAIGQWYEAIIYERVLNLTDKNTGYAVIKKGSDIWWRNRTHSKLGQDGLFYDLAGAIVARGNGQDLAEFDLLLTDRQNEIAFGEVKISGINLEELDKEIEYKRRLLEHILHRPVESVLISCAEIGNKTVIKRIASKPKNYLAITRGVNELLSKVQQEEIHTEAPLSSEHRSILLSNLKQGRIGYLELHDRCRDEIINAVSSGREVNFEEGSWLIKRLVLGYLNEASVRRFFNDRKVIVKREMMTIDSNAFSKLVFALRMPELRPEVYLKVKKKPVYLKMGPFTASTFGFERNIRRTRTAFFYWLENAQLEIGPDLLDNLISRFLIDDILGSRKKLGESPDIS